MAYKTVEDLIGNTPVVRLQRLTNGPTTVLCKLEGDNPAGSVKDRPAYRMIVAAEERGTIRPGDTLIEATSGNTGIALAMVAAIKGYRMVLVMPEHMSAERRALMKAYGAEVVLTPKEASMEGAIDHARALETAGEGKILDQFSNPDNPDAHYRTTGPEIWNDTGGTVTHFVASTGTIGTLMGTSRYLKERNPSIRVVGVTPDAAGGSPESVRGHRPTCRRYTTSSASTKAAPSPGTAPSRRCVASPRKRAYSPESPREGTWRSPSTSRRSLTRRAGRTR
jgi:cysteine synthase B